MIISKKILINQSYTHYFFAESILHSLMGLILDKHIFLSFTESRALGLLHVYSFTLQYVSTKFSNNNRPPQRIAVLPRMQLTISPKKKNKKRGGVSLDYKKIGG